MTGRAMTTGVQEGRGLVVVTATGLTDPGPDRPAVVDGIETATPAGDPIGRGVDLRVIHGSMIGPVLHRLMKGNGRGREDVKGCRP